MQAFRQLQSICERSAESPINPSSSNYVKQIDDAFASLWFERPGVGLTERVEERPQIRLDFRWL